METKIDLDIRNNENLPKPTYKIYHKYI